MQNTNDGLKQVLVEWHEFTLPVLVSRDIDWVLFDENRIVCIIGPRRAGKTWVCYQALGRLLHSGVPRGNIVYVNFEDERLLPCDGSELSLLLSLQAELYPTNTGYPRYVILDEVHNVPRWSQWVRRICEQNLDVRVILTGSSSRLLSTEIATELRGRSAAITVFPYSFAEFARASGLGAPDANEPLLLSPRRVELKRCFNDYFLRGGFPEIAQRERYRETLQQYYRTMFTRDMVERFSIRNVRQFEDFLSIQMSRCAALSSVSNIEKAMRGLGYSLSKNTLTAYLRYAEDAHLLFSAARFDRKVTVQMRHPRKIYAVDHGLLNAIRFSASEDRGRILENVAYMELRRRHESLFYHAGATECDFIARAGTRITHCYQVCWSLENPSTAEREYRGLLEAARAYGLTSGTILTDSDSAQLEQEGVSIHVIPLWYFALQPRDTDPGVS